MYIKVYIKRYINAYCGRGRGQIAEVAALERTWPFVYTILSTNNYTLIVRTLHGWRRVPV